METHSEKTNCGSGLKQPPKMTPMFEQYMGIKQEYPNALLFYRMGDFFELFFDDAVITAKELQLTLTSRNPDAENPVPMCGVPHHALDNYLPQLLERGYTLAICDQIENPKEAKGLVKRAITRILTPGTVIEDSSLHGKEHNYLGALYWDSQAASGGFAWAENSTGEWSGLYSTKESELWQWVQKIAPRELLLPDGKEAVRVPPSVDLRNIRKTPVPFASFFALKSAARRVIDAQRVQDLDTLGLGGKTPLLMACGAIVAYLTQTQRQELTHLAPFKPLNLGKFLIIDEVTEKNLELFRCLNGQRGKGTLRHVLDETMTPMGGRMLEERLRQPWREQNVIENTQTVVAHLVAEPEKTEILRKALSGVYDLERLSTRIALDRSMPRDFGALRNSLRAIPAVYDALSVQSCKTDHYPTAADENGQNLPAALADLLKQWDNLADIRHLLESSLADELPLQLTDGGLFRQGFNAELDELMDLTEHGEQRLQDLLLREQEQNNLPKLKLGFNRVFGYYFELSRAATSSVPEHFNRRQTLANAERYTTEELKALEEKIQAAMEKKNSLEFALFKTLRAQVAAEQPRLTFMAHLLAQADYWQTLAHVAVRNGWCRPQLHDGLDILIRQGRHPVVEQIQGKGTFIPNDLHIDERRRLILITGPNMSGKSTILRQTAIIALLAHMGSFVPAAEARIGLMDRIFSRVGASDNLAQGQSTFMVEMMETARILRQAGKRSFVILDEIGRGTSTYDGLAIAWAVVEDLIKRASASVRTLFATHYHELTVLDGVLPGVHNMNVAIKEWNGELVFLRRLVPGPSNRSYGVEVAKLAGVPSCVVQRAKQILQRLSKIQGALKNVDHMLQQDSPAFLPGLELLQKPEDMVEAPEPAHHPEPPVMQALRDLDVDNLSPLNALALLHDWKMLWGGKDKDHEEA